MEKEIWEDGEEWQKKGTHQEAKRGEYYESTLLRRIERNFESII